MAQVVVAPRAARDLAEMTDMLRVPADARSRVARRLRILERFPRSALELPPPFALRVLIGPWPSMLLVYLYEAGDGLVAVVTIQDARASTAPGA